MVETQHRTLTSDFYSLEVEQAAFSREIPCWVSWGLGQLQRGQPSPAFLTPDPLRSSCSPSGSSRLQEANLQKSSLKIIY